MQYLELIKQHQEYRKQVLQRQQLEETLVRKQQKLLIFLWEKNYRKPFYFLLIELKNKCNCRIYIYPWWRGYICTKLQTLWENLSKVNKMAGWDKCVPVNKKVKAQGTGKIRQTSCGKIKWTVVWRLRFEQDSKLSLKV